jgi:hypothetical protein
MGKTKKTEILVKVVQLGAKTEEVCLEPGSCGRDALVAAEMDTNVTIKVNGTERDLDYVLKDGDRITIADKVKGAM